MLSIVLAALDVLIVLSLVILAIGPKRFFYRIRRLLTSAMAGSKAV